MHSFSCCVRMSREQKRLKINPSLNGSLRIPEIEVQRDPPYVPDWRIARGAVLSPVVRVQHHKTLVGPLDARCVPFFIPGMRRASVKDLGRAIGIETEAMNKKVAFEHQHVAIGCRIGSIYPTELGPVPIAYQDFYRETKTECQVDSYPVFFFDLSRLDRSKIFIATAEE